MKKISTEILEQELADILEWFESQSSASQLDTALAKHARASEIVAELEARLQAAEVSIKKLET